MAAMVVEDDLWAYRAELAARLQETQAELQRVNAALRAFTGSRGRTFDLLRAFIASDGEADAHTALVYLMSHGWEPESRGNPLNAVRSALAHLAASGEIQRVSRGVYRATEELQQDNDREDVMAGTRLTERDGPTGNRPVLIAGTRQDLNGSACQLPVPVG